jgi:hypothetical protein
LIVIAGAVYLILANGKVSADVVSRKSATTASNITNPGVSNFFQKTIVTGSITAVDFGSTTATKYFQVKVDAGSGNNLIGKTLVTYPIQSSTTVDGNWIFQSGAPALKIGQKINVAATVVYDAFQSPQYLIADTINITSSAKDMVTATGTAGTNGSTTTPPVVTILYNGKTIKASDVNNEITIKKGESIHIDSTWSKVFSNEMSRWSANLTNGTADYNSVATIKQDVGGQQAEGVNFQAKAPGSVIVIFSLWNGEGYSQGMGKLTVNVK